ncbi:RNA polymerase sigma factor [Desulfoluna butyratoxydans]|uniref:Rna polymerase sigma factor region 2 n=1 Tax=Desulfoluna butyratoxydans TaxID=231438 RepID=A0A4U8YL03_9BACT|nr:RNA polymerase sigma factor [Desulfoluna butyratoxydans]VFQ44207.1 rna polymerase sigma factor region 2 [Desulfoluna butyratoxydans]
MGRDANRVPDITDQDTELITAIQNGAAERFEELVTRYEGKLYNFGLRICKDASDAEDLAQETFINIFRYLKDFRQETKFKNWMYRIATSVCHRMRRRSKYAPERELSLDEFLPADHADIDTELPEWAAMPIRQVLNRELGEYLKASVKELPPQYRLVLVLRDMEGFSTDETAEILGITPANVKVRLHRARLFLREELKGYFHDSQPHTP